MDALFNLSTRSRRAADGLAAHQFARKIEFLTPDGTSYPSLEEAEKTAPLADITVLCESSDGVKTWSAEKLLRYNTPLRERGKL